MQNKAARNDTNQTALTLSEGEPLVSAPIRGILDLDFRQPHDVIQKRSVVSRKASRLVGKVLRSHGLSKTTMGEDQPGNGTNILSSGNDEPIAQGSEMLDSIRSAFSKFSDSKRRALDSYLDKSAPSFLIELFKETARDEEDKYLSWSTWFADVATDGQIVEFFQWHVDVLSEQAKSKNLEAAITHEKDEYKEVVRKGAKEGWLHESAAQTVTKIDDTNVLVGDIFDTLLEAVGGYSAADFKTVVIAPGVGSNPAQREKFLLSNVERYVRHEFNHAVLGSMPYRWLREALTEHIALATKYGRPDVVYPLSRPEDTYRYKSERSLLYVLLERGSKQIPASLATRAYSDPDGIEGDAYKEFVRQIDESWGAPNTLGRIQHRLQEYEALISEDQTLSRATVEARAVQKVHNDLYHLYKLRP